MFNHFYSLKQIKNNIEFNSTPLLDCTKYSSKAYHAPIIIMGDLILHLNNITNYLKKHVFQGALTPGTKTQIHGN